MPDPGQPRPDDVVRPEVALGETGWSSRGSNEELRHLARRVIEDHEAERAHLARELHDDVSQRLALLAVNLHVLGQSLPDGADKVQSAVGDLYREAQALARDVRRLSHGLHPARLEQLGLVPAVRGLCSDISAAQGTVVAFNAGDIPADVPDAVALCLYRVAQEALHNVVKHARATTVSVDLTATRRRIQLAVRDDGCGFRPEGRQRHISLGLASMRERIRSVGGRLSIRSEAGRGTRVEAHVPLVAGGSLPAVARRR